MRRSPGYVLHAMMIVLAALAALLFSVSTRIEAGNAGRIRAERRVQAMWLARSAVATRAAASREVTLAPGVVARVRIHSFGSGRYAADVVVPGAGAARVEQTFAADGRISAVSESWRTSN